MGLSIQKLQQLLVVNLPATPKNPAPVWDGKEAFFAPESCARQLLVGTFKDKGSLPSVILDRALKTLSFDSKIKPRMSTLVEEGRRAYEYILGLACGLQSQKKGEHYILGQVKRAWKKYEVEFPARAKEISTIVQAVFEDANKIRHAILEKLRVLSQEIAATTLAGIKGGENILLIAGKYEQTMEAARALGRSNTRKVNSITVTHSDRKTLTERVEEMLKAKRQKAIISEICKKPFDDALVDIDKFDHVFVCQDMGSDNDELIADIWKHQLREGNHLVFLKGNPNDRGNSTNFWKESRLNGLILPEDIKLQFQKDREENIKTLELAQRACSVCSERRENGHLIREHQLIGALS